MKFLLTDTEIKQINQAAVQNVIQKRFQAALESRITEIETELQSLEDNLTAEQISKQYLEPRIIQVQPTLLVPKH